MEGSSLWGLPTFDGTWVYRLNLNQLKIAKSGRGFLFTERLYS